MNQIKDEHKKIKEENIERCNLVILYQLIIKRQKKIDENNKYNYLYLQ